MFFMAESPDCSQTIHLQPILVSDIYSTGFRHLLFHRECWLMVTIIKEEEEKGLISFQNTNHFFYYQKGTE